MQTVLDYFRGKINTKISNNEGLLSRRAMIEELYRENKNASYYLKNSGQFDSIRRQLTVCGYIKESNISGCYEVVKPVESELNSGELRRRYNNIINGKQHNINDRPLTVYQGTISWESDNASVFKSIWKKIINMFF